MNATEQQRQSAAGQAVRDRLMRPDDWIRRAAVDRIRADLQKETERNQAIMAENEALKAKVMRHDGIVSSLQLDLADRDARILSQASRICSLENLGMTDRPGKKPVADIIGEVLAEFPDVSWKDISGIRRHQRLITPRHKCMFEVSRQRPDLSYPSIGRIFGGRDHTSILHAVRKMDAALSEGREGEK